MLVTWTIRTRKADDLWGGKVSDDRPMQMKDLQSCPARLAEYFLEVFSRKSRESAPQAIF